jgi:hypothetical protein
MLYPQAKQDFAELYYIDPFDVIKGKKGKDAGRVESIRSLDCSGLFCFVLFLPFKVQYHMLHSFSR